MQEIMEMAIALGRIIEPDVSYLSSDIQDSMRMGYSCLGDLVGFRSRRPIGRLKAP